MIHVNEDTSPFHVYSFCFKITEEQSIHTCKDKHKRETKFKYILKGKEKAFFKFIFLTHTALFIFLHRAIIQGKIPPNKQILKNIEQQINK